jgi:hypothetical protein
MKTAKIFISLFTVLFLGLAPAVSSAEDGDGKVVQTLDLGSEALDGELLGPNKDFMSSRKISIMNSLIQFRDDFIAEMIKSAEDL